MVDLPSEIIGTILGHAQSIYTCLFINKTFYKEARAILWRHLEIPNRATLIKITGALATCGHLVRHLNCGYALTDTELADIIVRLPRLTHLVAMNQLNDAVGKCPRLTNIHARGVTPEAMVLLTQLRHIDLEYGQATNLVALAACPLETLTLTRCHDDPAGVTELRHLTALTINESESDWTPVLAATWSRLTKLTLSCPSLTDTEAIRFIQAHPDLTHLALYNSHITDRTLETIATHLPSIKVLGLDGTKLITPKGIRRLVKQCLDLGLLTTFGCQIFPDDFPEANEAYFECEEDDLLHISQMDEYSLEEIRTQDDSDEDP